MNTSDNQHQHRSDTHTHTHAETVIVMAWINIERDRIAPVDDPNQDCAVHDANPAPARHRQGVPLVPAEKQHGRHQADNNPIDEKPNPTEPRAAKANPASALAREQPDTESAGCLRRCAADPASRRQVSRKQHSGLAIFSIAAICQHEILASAM
jgi:hypothetical protein